MRNSYYVIEWVSPWVVQSSDCIRNIYRLYTGISFTRSQTRRNSTTSTISISPDPSLSVLVNHRLLIDWNVPATLLSFHVESTVRDYRKEDLFTMFCYFAPVTSHSVQTMLTMFSRKDFFRLFDGLLRVFTRKPNAEPRCLVSLGGHDGAIGAAKHRELVHAHHLANPYTDLTNYLWGTKY